MRIGSHYLGGDRCEFVVWAPLSDNVRVKIVSPEERIIPLTRDDRGYWRANVGGIAPGTLYFYRLHESTDSPHESADRPDPTSCFQPVGVHGPSQVIDHTAFRWKDARWRG